MSSQKQPGTLRDFNLDGNLDGKPNENRDGYRSAHRESPSKSGVTETAVKTMPNQSVNQSVNQTVKSQSYVTANRKPSLTEWEDPDQFWSSWEKDFEGNQTRQTTQALRPRPPSLASPAASTVIPTATAKTASKVAPVLASVTRQTTAVASAAAKSAIKIPVKSQTHLSQTAVQRPQVAIVPASPATETLDQTQSDEGGQLQSENLGLLAWATEVALQERRSERLGVVDFTNAYQKQDLLKKMTLEFMLALRRSFQEQIEIFNDSRKNPAQNIQLYRVSNTAEDFMIFRNGVKLVVSGQRSGRIVFAFNQFLGQIFAPRAPNTFEIEASWGAFDQLNWNYRNEKVGTAEIVRYFLTEFSRQSVR